MIENQSYFEEIAKTNGESLLQFIQNTAMVSTREGWGSDRTMLALSEVIGRPIHFFSKAMDCQYLVYTSDTLVTTPISLVLDKEHFSALLPTDNKVIIYEAVINPNLLCHQYSRIPFHKR